jgi:hypothetical protein
LGSVINRTCVAEICRFPPKTLSDPRTEMYLSCLFVSLQLKSNRLP